MQRRSFLKSTIGLGFSNALFTNEETVGERFFPPAFSIIPVIADGKWISREEPGEKGYLESREFDVSIGMRFKGAGPGRRLEASTVVPIEYPEQKILKFSIERNGCFAEVVSLGDGGAQLFLRAPTLSENQTVSAFVNFRIQLCKSYFGYQRDQFPQLQKTRQAPPQFLKSSPGIKIASAEVKGVLNKLRNPTDHPWELARKFYDFVWENIAGKPGRYTSVEMAIKKQQGDCEERACTFIALCRAAGIPARQVWVPNHVWAEIAMHDEDGIWHWIPVHTAAYNWFGWTGVHELILQKGDRFKLPVRNRVVRLIDDWYRLAGPKPTAEYSARIMPVAPEGKGDAGPGAREKRSDRQWHLVGSHSMDRFMRSN